MFEASVGASYDADIAIDDIDVTKGYCPSRYKRINAFAVKCKSGKCVSSTNVCDFVNNCGVGDNTDEQNCGGLLAIPFCRICLYIASEVANK